MGEIRNFIKTSLLTKGGVGRLPYACRRIVETTWGLALRKKPTKCILLIHEGRVGSTIVGKLLNAQPGIHWDGEVYTKLEMNDPASFQQKLKDTDFRQNYLRGRMYRAAGGIYGCEIKCGQFAQSTDNLEAEAHMLHALTGDLIVCLLFRRNLIRHLASIKQGMLNANWHDGKPTSHRIHLDVQSVFPNGVSLFSWLNRHITMRDQIIKAFGQWIASEMPMFYEDHVGQDPNVAAARISTVAGIAYTKDLQSIRSYKNKSMRELIANFDEVEAYLDGSAFQHMLND